MQLPRTRTVEVRLEVYHPPDSRHLVIDDQVLATGLSVDRGTIFPASSSASFSAVKNSLRFLHSWPAAYVERNDARVRERSGSQAPSKVRCVPQDVTHLSTIALRIAEHLKAATVTPRDVFRFALGDHAAAVIVFHNHPSGDPSPSPQDLAFTEKLATIGTQLGFDVIDHIIVTSSSFLSLKQHGHM